MTRKRAVGRPPSARRWPVWKVAARFRLEPGDASRMEHWLSMSPCLSPDGAQRIWEKDSGASAEAEVIGARVAHKLRERGAAALLVRETRGTRA